VALWEEMEIPLGKGTSQTEPDQMGLYVRTSPCPSLNYSSCNSCMIILYVQSGHYSHTGLAKELKQTDKHDAHQDQIEA
jgi:hypothetical protein